MYTGFYKRADPTDGAEGIIPRCRINFKSEKELIDNILKKKQALSREEVHPFRNLQGLLEKVELNIEKFNDAVHTLWVGNSLSSFPAMLQQQHPAFRPEDLQLRVEPASDTVLQLKFASIISYFTTKTPEDAAKEVVNAYENVYSSAWRVVTLCRELIDGMRNLKPKGITFMRNKIMEHPTRKVRRTLRSISISADTGIVITYKETQAGQEDKVEEIALQLEQDILEFKEELHRKLTLILQNQDD